MKVPFLPFFVWRSYCGFKPDQTCTDRSANATVSLEFLVATPVFPFPPTPRIFFVPSLCSCISTLFLVYLTLPNPPVFPTFSAFPGVFFFLLVCPRGGQPRCRYPRFLFCCLVFYYFSDRGNRYSVWFVDLRATSRATVEGAREGAVVEHTSPEAAQKNQQQ